MVGMIGLDAKMEELRMKIISTLEHSKYALTRQELEIILGTDLPRNIPKVIKKARIYDRLPFAWISHNAHLYYLTEEQLENRLELIRDSIPVIVQKSLQ